MFWQISPTVKFFLQHLNNEQIKHIAGSLRILGVAVFLNLFIQTNSHFTSALFLLLWVFCEMFAIMVLRLYKAGE